MEKLISKTMEKLKLQEENLLFERLTKDSLFQVLSELAQSINLDVDIKKAEFKKYFNNIKYDNDLKYDDFYLANNTIYLSKELKLQNFKTKVYVLSCALVSFLMGTKEKTLLDEGLEETLASMIASNVMQGSFSSKNRMTRDYAKMLLALDDPYKLMAEYVFDENKLAFKQKLEGVVRRNNLPLKDFYDLNSNRFNRWFNPNDYDHIFANFDLNTLIYYCFNKNSKNQFLFDNIFLKNYIIRRYLRGNYFNIESLEALALNMPSSLNLTDDFSMITNYLNKYPNDFYRIRLFIDESSLNSNIKAFINRNDASFDAIVKDIKRGKFACDLKQYTYCYNPYASNSDRLMFLEKLVESKGITNGFLLNELLEVFEQKRINNLNDRDKAYNLIEEATSQFWNFKVNRENASYDAYTSKVLNHSLYLMNRYYFDDERVSKKKYKSKSMKMIYSLNEYEKLARYEFSYLMFTYGRNDLLRNPESLSNDELLAIINDKNVRINQKYFQEVLKSRGISKSKFNS